MGLAFARKVESRGLVFCVRSVWGDLLSLDACMTLEVERFKHD